MKGQGIFAVNKKRAGIAPLFPAFLTVLYAKKLPFYYARLVRYRLSKRTGGIRMSMGERIKQARLAKKMTQEDVAQAIGTTKQTVFKYENGIVSNIPLDKLTLLAQVLEVSPAYLMGWETPPPLPGEKPKYKSLGRLEEMGELSKEEDEIIANYIAFIKQQRGE